MPTAAPRGAHPRAPLAPRVPAAGAAMLLAGILSIAGCSTGATATQPVETPRPTNNGSLFDLDAMSSTPGTIRVKVGSGAELTLAASVAIDQTQGAMTTATGTTDPAASGAAATGAPAASGAAATGAPAASGAPAAGSAGADTTVEVSWSALTSTGRVSVSGSQNAVASLDADCVQSLDRASPTDFTGTIQCAAHPTARSTEVVPLMIAFEFGGDGAD